ncbi:MAG: hypothetical protein EHM20_10040 [Alphaproteobacteria bacterium]|nr:MAG: hypothetical protein EHM20_10040 [Alphaproteobacteria bacterium]
MKQHIIYSKKVKEPTLVLVLPEEDSFELKKEIEDFIAGSTVSSTQKNLPEIYEPVFERRAFLPKRIRIQTSDVKEYIEENGLNFDGKDLETKDGTEDVDWLSFFSKMVQESNLKLIENDKFVNAIKDTLFSSLLGYSIAIGGYMKEPEDTMVGINYQRRGLVWLSYPDKTMKVILRKGIYDEVDSYHRVIYSKKMEGINDAIEEGRIKTSQVKSSTFGNYPFYLAEDLKRDHLNDPDFIRDLIQKATEL